MTLLFRAEKSAGERTQRCSPCAPGTRFLRSPPKIFSSAAEAQAHQELERRLSETEVVRAAEARAELGIQAGDKLLVMRHPVYKGLMICKIDELQMFLNEFSEFVQRMQKSAQQQEEEA